MASASPRASMTVVLEVGARFSGQASCSMLTSRTTCEFFASVEFASPQTAMIFTWKRAMAGRIRSISSVSPLALKARTVAVRDHAKVAVQAFANPKRPQESRCSSASTQFFPMALIFNAQDDNLATASAPLDQLDRPGKIFVQALAQALELEDFHIENAPGFSEIIHSALIVRRSGGAGKDSRSRRRRLAFRFGN